MKISRLFKMKLFSTIDKLFNNVRYPVMCNSINMTQINSQLIYLHNWSTVFENTKYKCFKSWCSNEDLWKLRYSPKVLLNCAQSQFRKKILFIKKSVTLFQYCIFNHITLQWYKTIDMFHNSKKYVIHSSFNANWSKYTFVQIIWNKIYHKIKHWRNTLYDSNKQSYIICAFWL